MSKKNRNVTQPERSSRQNSRNVVKQFEAQERRRNQITFGVIGVVVLLMIGGVIWSITANKVDKNTKVIEPSAMTKDYGIVYDSEAAGGEKVDAKAKVVLWEDFSCPFCKQFEAAAGDQLDEAVKAGEAEVEYRVVGFLDDGPAVNNHSKRAASAALCVRESNDTAGWKRFHDWLYENQPEEGSEGQTNTEFIEAAEDLGLAVDETCVKSERYVPYMQKATDAFNEANIGGTPTITVNGKDVDATPEALAIAIDNAQE